MKKRISLILMSVLVMMCLFQNAGFAQETGGEQQLGLQVNDDGMLMKDGIPYRGIGVNYYSGFVRTLEDPANSDTSYRDGFQVLGEHHIPFARFSVAPYYPSQWQLYKEDKEKYFEILDDFVHSAEQNHVGLIPSFFWTSFSVADMVGEPINRWGSLDSEVQQFMKQYVSEVVSRYKDSPAIWGWEFGNEYNLSSDLPNASEWRPPVIPELGTPTFRTADDELTHAMIRSAFTVFATEVRKYDPDRIIISGNSLPRSSEWHQEQYLSWDQDTEQQFADMLNKDNPDPMDTISVHIYDMQEQRFSRTVPVEELLGKLMQISTEANKPLFVGEFGTSESIGHEPARQNFERLITAVHDAGVPFAAVWVFDLPNQPENTITDTNAKAYQLDRIREVNESYVNVDAIKQIVTLYEGDGQITGTLATQLQYRLGIIQILIAQGDTPNAIAYLTDFLNYINDASVQQQQLLSPAATGALNRGAGELIRIWSQ
ncbi:FIMAH domain-containing protein [Paenibacillus nasutitermitis]|uniref:mannan endo-1,4-beta-mannosidase n=1 Tax=Paenibacillus nasutitermitis TaxID=1652958 RepID=A0A916ZCY0_9BACL|nr:cellulase family glycosylhydrolase [Paenibacillus nasutitermitis]GGD88967.1 hypothetical protein GCM10010911_54460 [Paenibacillus nasutitermitis]